MAYFGYRIRYEALRSIDSSGFDTTYQNLGAEFSNPIVLMKIQNDSNVDATFSFDGGTTDQDIVPAGTFALYDFSANKLAAPIAAIPEGTQVQVKGSAGTGNVYLTAIYIEER